MGRTSNQSTKRRPPISPGRPRPVQRNPPFARTRPSPHPRSPTLIMQKESPNVNQPELAFLQLLHLADSAFPIGALSHSFGLETLVAANQLSPKSLEIFLQGYLEEAGATEAVFCREAAKLANESASDFPVERWREINETLAALKPARESRDGSASL